MAQLVGGDGERVDVAAHARNLAQRERVRDAPSTANHAELAVAAAIREVAELRRGREPRLDVVGTGERRDAAGERVRERARVADPARHRDRLLAERGLSAALRPVQRDREATEQPHAQNRVAVGELLQRLFQ